MMRTATVLAGALALVGCGSSEEAQAPAAKPIQGEKLTVARTTVPQSKPLAAEIATRDQAEAMVRIPGTLVDLRVNEGDWVKRGERIGRVVDNRIGHETGALAAQVAAATAQAEAARAELERIQYLYDRGVYAKARLDQAQAAARAAAAQVRAAQQQQSASASVAGQGVILAPATGRVLRADVPQGSVVSPGMSVATVTAGPPLLRLDVPQALADQVKPGARVTIHDASELDGRQGTIVQLYPAVQGGRVRADAEVPGLNADLVGRRVSVTLDVGTRDGIVVPRKFVSTRFGTDYVTVIDKDGKATSVPVQTAPVAGSATVEILSGVSAGDVIVAESAGR
ncbi:efflux RND transporter periplasmic adaptor subunit [Stakelama tenebrarum]|uniref:Efflux RND transporter periplasmic adaptor subunit n=1 Tax=Stakelama tenebrarum TaxID=2711215 RepID=A0A6G6Y5K4_9SPHN|nr:efflux RND transporter periplasmic adaptor subunit [Sphingosinithalassobacter tenebrarum]QIG79856.1 efflux RND transporter periplasmic adaptor subunit [Sphingosinithalassobacter tenebrarum]